MAGSGSPPSAEKVFHAIGMSSLHDLNGTTFFDPVDHGFAVLAMHETRREVYGRGFLLEWGIRELHEREPRDQRIPRAVSAVGEPHQCYVLPLVTDELTFLTVECHQATGTPQAESVHDLLASYD
jgi:hypothetical protein